MDFCYVPKGVCAKKIDFQLDQEGKLHKVCFTGGCSGNLQAIGKLVEGADADQIASLLSGNLCGPRSTSCADQLSKAILKAMEESRGQGEEAL